MTKCKCTHNEIHVQVIMCTKTKVRTGTFQVYIAPLWICTSPNQVECRQKKERENLTHSHHYPTEGATSQQTHLPIPINDHKRYTIFVK